MSIDPRRAAEELARREASLVRASSVVEGIRAELFDRQLAFVDDPDTNKAAMCTRRAGKTMMWPRYCFIVALQHPKSLLRVWGITRLRAKQLLWQEFLDVAARHKIHVQAHETEAWIRLDNGSEIRFLGADKLKEAEKKRGDKTRMEVVLETQLFGPYLRILVEDVAEPCLSDLQGTMCLEGTPGPVPTGYWYNITGSEEAQQKDLPRWQSQGRLVSTGNLTDGGEEIKETVGAGWSVHHWSHLDNPFLPKARENLAKLKTKRQWDDDHPTYVREWRGWWAVDNGVLFYKFNEHRNTYTLSEVKPWGPGWTHVLGWDLGHTDSMALVAWGWHPSSRNLYEAASWSKSGAPEEEVMEKIKEWEKLGFNFIAKVADTQGGGKITVEHAMANHSQVFENAAKGDKPGHVRLMNDDFLTGKIKVQRGGGYALELAALPKDPDWDPDSGKPPGEDPRFPNHRCFIAGTQVLVRGGSKAIEHVRVGDEVLTRVGYKRVVKSASTGVREVIERAGLTGTPEHPVWTEGRGWQRLDSILDTDVLLYAWNNLGSSRGTGSSGTGTQSRSAEPIASTTSDQSQARSRSGYIERSGSTTTARSQIDTTSTTETRTPSTTRSETLSRSLDPSTSLSIKPSGGPRRLLSSALRALRSLVQKLLSGIDRLRGVLGIESTQAVWPQDCRAIHLPVPNAESTSRLLRALGSVRLAARTDGTVGLADYLEWTTKLEAAASAAKSSESTSTQNKRTAVVYALSVADQHEFFANGVLVSNCDAGLYSWRRAYAYLDYEPEKAVETPQETQERLDEERLSKVQQKLEFWDARDDHDA